MKKIISLLSDVIKENYSNSVFHLDVIRRFSIAENSNNYDHVYLVYDLLSSTYFVIWKWTTSKSFSLRSFNSYSDAYDFYRDRHDFACQCN